MPKCINCTKTQAKLNNGSLCKECFTINDTNEFIITDEINSDDGRSPLFQTNSYDREIIEVLKNGLLQEKNCDVEIKLLLKEQITIIDNLFAEMKKYDKLNKHSKTSSSSDSSSNSDDDCEFEKIIIDKYDVERVDTESSSLLPKYEN